MPLAVLLRDITSGLPDDPREEDEKTAERQLRDLRPQGEGCPGGGLDHAGAGGDPIHRPADGRAVLRTVRDHRRPVPPRCFCFGTELKVAGELQATTVTIIVTTPIGIVDGVLVVTLSDPYIPAFTVSGVL